MEGSNAPSDAIPKDQVQSPIGFGRIQRTIPEKVESGIARVRGSSLFGLRRRFRGKIQAKPIESRWLKALLHDFAKFENRVARPQGVHASANFYVIGNYKPLIESSIYRAAQFQKFLIAKFVKSDRNAKNARQQKRDCRCA